jgi:hypothetical protein
MIIEKLISEYLEVLGCKPRMGDMIIAKMIKNGNPNPERVT